MPHAISAASSSTIAARIDTTRAARRRWRSRARNHLRPWRARKPAASGTPVFLTLGLTIGFSAYCLSYLQVPNFNS
jgi:hypothetical protein